MLVPEPDPMIELGIEPGPGQGTQYGDGGDDTEEVVGAGGIADGVATTGP
jgi:hypothetical protein